MAGKRVNVLIYSGQGASLASVRHATWSLRRLLGANYSIQTVSSDQILKEPWQSTCALLVFPGGADAGYCRLLNGEGNRKIKNYVHTGGKYLGLCAGGYYGSARCEFELGKKGMEVVGDRELAFFPGVCRGLAFKGFVYQSEAGAKAVKLTVDQNAFSSRITSATFCSYYNGGGVFVDAEKFKAQGIEILARFAEGLDVEAGEASAAVVFAKVGEGAAIVTGPHPEFAGANLSRDEPSNPSYGEIVDALLADDIERADFVRACLSKLGLEVSNDSHMVPSLSRMHLSSSEAGMIEEWLQSWREDSIVVTDGNSEFIKGEQDIFKLEETNRFRMSNMRETLSTPVKNAANVLLEAMSSPVKSSPAGTDNQTDSSADRIHDSEEITKTLIVHTASLPDAKETPHFNHAAFFVNLQRYNSQQSSSLQNTYGRVLLYGEVVTSTQTLLEKNPTWLSHLPIGTTAVATTQVSGRGRGTNVWVSPPGSLMFSTMLKHPMSLSSRAPVIFIQYLAALAIIDGIHAYEATPTASGSTYSTLPVKLKWPNDIYALDPDSPASKPSYIKIGGILVNSSYSGGDYTLIVGIGLNLSNPGPTASLLQLTSQANLPAMTQESLLASILVQFERLYATFTGHGFHATLERKYYSYWLHTDQIVTLEMEGGVRARIRGITNDWGLLVAEEVDSDNEGTGRRWELQSDSNSFDFFKGLVRRKV